MRRRSWGISVGVWLVATAAQAQQAQPSHPATPPADEPLTSTEVMPVPEELLHVTPGGLTADKVGERAGSTSYTAKAAEHTMRAAAARADAAWAQFLPRVTGMAKYTRLSSYTVGDITFGGATIPGSTVFPLFLDQYSLTANINVPITDYFLRINQQYTATTRSVDAAKFDVATARAKSASDGRIAYYQWLRARGNVIVAVQALNDSRTHLKDARNLFTVGNASRADVLRAETAVATAELTVERAKDLALLAEKQVRVAMHAEATESLVPGEGADDAPKPLQGNVAQLENEALASRFEVKSIDANADSARKLASAAKSTRYPNVSAFGDGIYANPNPRYFPQQATWFPTWDVGVQATWSPNDILIANGNSGDAESRANALEAQKQVTRDGISIEVTQAFNAVREADIALDSTRRELASATEAYRVAKELFENGRGTSTTLTDAEGELTRARLDQLNARIDARVARVQLDHALGRDTRLVGQP